jgi:multiple sugar transport system permease protein
MTSGGAMLGYVLIAPSVILLAGLLGWPLVEAIILSFYKVNPMTLQSSFVGLENYAATTSDASFWNALGNNFIWLGGSLVLQIGAGVGCALLLNRSFPGRSLARALILFPYLLPVVVTALVWQWMLDPLYGIVNETLLRFGLQPHDWLGSMPEAMVAVITVGSWRVFPFVVIAVLARLQSIPRQLYEAAAVDGASGVARFWDITVPQLSRVLFVIILLRAIWDFREFDLIFLLTGGGPVAGTTTLPILVYREAFSLFRMGRALAIAVVMLAIMAAFIAVYFRVARRMHSTEEA